jgi:acetyl esterase
MGIVEKRFPASDFELRKAEASRHNAAATRLPLWLLRRYVLTHLEGFRNPPDVAPPVETQVTHEITEHRHALPGRPAPLGVTVHHRSHYPPGRPLVFFIHGGGFLGGVSWTNTNLLHLLVDATGCVAASVDYALAPEAKHPTPLDDCEAALRLVLGSPDYGVDPTRVFLMGDSAGGNLAAALTLRLCAGAGPRPRGQILLYPVTDLDRLDSPSYRDRGIEYTSMRQILRVARDCYLPDKAARRDPYATVLYAQLDEPQPDALILVAERDGLRDDGLRYAEKLANAGTEVRAVRYREAFHAFINDLGRSGTADDAADEILAFLRERM